MAYTYRKVDATHPKNETLAHYDGVKIARIHQFDGGPQENLWGWFGKWSGPNNSGRADSLEEALDAVKYMHQKLVEGGGEHRWPDH